MREPVARHVADHLPAAEERRHGVEQLGPCPQAADAARAQHLVPGEAHEVGVPGRHVDRQVRHRLGRVDEDQRPRGVSGVDERPDVVDRAEHVRHRGDREQAGAVEEAVEVGEVEAVVVGQRDPAQLDAALGREDVPRDDVRVVLHVGDDDRVTGAQVRPRPAVGDEVDRLGDVLGEHDLARLPAEEAGDLRAGVLVAARRLLRDRVHAAVHVGVRLAVHAVHRVEHRLRLLRRRRRVEVHEALAVHLALQDREVGLDPSDVERVHAATRKASKPERSSSSASSAPPDATTRPSSRMWTRSGERYSRILR